MASIGITPPEGPPSSAPLNFLPLGIPPPISKISLPSGVPSGTSIKPGLLIFPTRHKVLVPLLFSLPVLANHCAPCKITCGTSDQVSTLLIVVGFPKSPPPTLAGKGGRW